MDIVEYKTVLKVLEMNCLLPNHVKNDVAEEIPLWNNLTLCFKNDCISIHGSLPEEIINYMTKNYPTDFHNLIIDSKSDDLVKISARSKETLVLFILVLNSYVHNDIDIKNKFNEIIACIYDQLITIANPELSSHEWMVSDSDNKDIYLETLRKTDESTYSRELRQLLSRFDDVVNPYQDKNISTNSAISFIDKVKISLNTYDNYLGKSRSNSICLTFEEIKSKNKVSYSRNSNGFCYTLEFTLNPETSLMILHYYSALDDRGEVIEINYYGRRSGERTNVKYNITHDKEVDTKGTKKPISFEHKNYIYNELVRGIAIASSITLDNITNRSLNK